MSLFEVYFKAGLDHITDWQGYDHMLFLIVIASGYLLKDWRRVLILATAFTVGHAFSMGMALGDILYIPSKYVEFLIPLTILLGCIPAILHLQSRRNTFPIVFVFGLIHGLGFSNFLKSMLGRGDDLFQPMLYFHIGLELGQLCIVLASLILTSLIIRFTPIKQVTWRRYLGILAGLIALYLMVDRRFW